MIDELRNMIAETDAEILALIRKRMDISKMIGEYKDAHGLPIQNDAVESDVIGRYRDFATENSLDPDLLESICRILIDGSKRAQERK